MIVIIIIMMMIIIIRIVIRMIIIRMITTIVIIIIIRMRIIGVKIMIKIKNSRNQRYYSAELNLNFEPFLCCWLKADQAPQD